MLNVYRSKIDLPHPSRCSYLERPINNQKKKRGLNGNHLPCVCLTRCASKLSFSSLSLASTPFDNSRFLLAKASSINGSVKLSITFRRGTTLSDQNSSRGQSLPKDVRKTERLSPSVNAFANMVEGWL
jgi:hypothetical protein